MPLGLDNTWFTEVSPNTGTAFSLKITGKLHEVQSPFQKIEIYGTETFGNLMVIDEFVMLTSRDNFLYHEMMAHPVLFTHPNPKRVLIIGGGDCGTLREVLRHPGVELVQQVDIDEEVTRAAEKFFPELCEFNSDPRAELYWVDGLKWVKEAEAGYYDVIIVDSTDPIGPAEGLFGKAFYSDCLRALGDDGLLVHQSESPLLHLDLMSEMRLAMRDAGFGARQTLQFPQPVYPSGWWTCTLAAKSGSIGEFRIEDAAKRPFKTLYYTPEVHQGARALPPLLSERFATE
jgi:spermidine synthase